MTKRVSRKVQAAAVAAVSLAAYQVEAAVLLTDANPYTQNFDNLNGTAASNYPTNTSNVTASGTILPSGWSMLEHSSGTQANQILSFGSGTSNTGDTYLFGAPSSPERSLGGTASGTILASFGAEFTNDTGVTISELTISYTGEQWRQGGNTSTQALFFDYSTNATALPTRSSTATTAGYQSAAGWSQVSQLNFVSPIVSPSTTTASAALDGNLTTNQALVSFTITGLSIADGSSFFIRWQDPNDPGNDHGLGIDSFSITPTLIPEPGTMTLVGMGALGLLGMRRRRPGAETASDGPPESDGPPVSDGPPDSPA